MGLCLSHPIEHLHPVEAIGVNGGHAVVVAPVLVRLDTLRERARTRCSLRGLRWERQRIATGPHWRRCDVANSLSGEESAMPEQFRPAAHSIVKRANCSGCAIVTTSAHHTRTLLR
jgi:hypothetical protein